WSPSASSERIQSEPPSLLVAASSVRLSHVANVEVGGVRHAVISAPLSYPQRWRAPMLICPFFVEAGDESELEVISWLVCTLGETTMTAAMQRRVLHLAPA